MEKNANDNITQYWNENKLEPVTLIHDILVNWWVILLGAITAAMVAFVASNMLYVPQYTTSATFAAVSRSGAGSYSSLGNANSMAETFGKIIKSSSMQKILQKELGKNEIDADIQTSLVGETNLLELRVTSSSPREAFDVINTIMEHYSDISYYSLGSAILEPLQEPGIPLSPTNPLNANSMSKKAFLGAGVLLVLLFAVLSYLKDTVKREDEVESKLDAKSLGAIPFEYKYKSISDLIHRKKEGLLINNPLAGFDFVESNKKMASRVEYQMEESKAKVLVVTSVSENEGKSTAAANLAITLAEKSGRVVIIDGDLRRPSQFLLLGKRVPEEKELGEYLKGNLQMRDVLMESNFPGLIYIGGKNCYSSSTELVQNGKLEELIKQLRSQVDYIIIDSPPAGIIGDSEIYASYADAVMLVSRQNYILAEDINDTLDRFRDLKCRVIGVVLNGVMTFGGFTSAAVGKYSKYGYGRYGKYAKYTKMHRNGE